MIEFSRLTVLILSELLLGLGLVTLVLISRALIRKQKAYKAAQQLVERIRMDMEPRSQRLRQILSNAFGYQGDDLEQTLHKLNRTEKQLYQNIINGFLKRDLIAFRQIDVDVDNLVLAYQGLEPSSRSDSDAVETTPSDTDKQEFERLQADNQRLAEELKVTMDTMARMISEYATMFSDETVGQADEEQVVLGDDQVDAFVGEPEDGALHADDPDPAGNEERSSSDVETLTDAGEDISDDGTETDGAEAQAVPDEKRAAVQQLDDEVLEVADEFSELVVNAMSQTNETDPEPAPQDSLVDELEQVDISTPQFDQAVSQEVVEAASLEEEWAKLLEEEAHTGEKEKPDDQAKSK
jgi:hypothetical protein